MRGSSGGIGIGAGVLVLRVGVPRFHAPHRPPGCSLHSIGTLQYNTLLTSPRSCSGTDKCVCQKSLVAATADNSAAITANSAALTLGGFGSLTTGTCASHGYGVITTAAECEAAAVALGWSDVDASQHTGSNSGWPPGCSLHSSGVLLYNTLTTSTLSCSGIYKCACKTPSLVAATADNSVAITANSAAIADNSVAITANTAAITANSVATADNSVAITANSAAVAANSVATDSNSAAVAANSAAILSGLYSIDTGTCASHGYGVITTAAECEAAAVALGWSDVVVDSSHTVSSGGWPPGCSLY